MKKFKSVLTAAAAVACLATGSAHASLTAFQQYNGNYGYSSSGFGSTTQAGTISASVPVGSTVTAAYLYTSTFFNATLNNVGGTLQGNTVNYSNIGVNASSCCSLTAGRADVTSIVKPLIDGGPGGVYNFSITETDASQDGEALVVVYSNPALPNSTVGILDGFSAVTGDNTAINFAKALHPGDPGFFAEMALGIGFSCCNQESTVGVNGTTITNVAGNNDDSVDGGPSNGNLITVGGYNDPYSPFLPTYDQDHERYNLVPYINDGDTSINISTVNPSHDDNIFLAVFNVLGEAGINQPPPSDVPEPGTLALTGLALAGIGAMRRKAKA
jgi:hypothetical protein